MSGPRGNKTTAKNLEEKFDREEDVLDYFDVSKARLVRPESTTERRQKLASPTEHTASRRVVVREKTARYRKAR
jgi:hypothetical protein